MSVQNVLEIIGFLMTIGGIVASMAYNNGKRDSLEKNLNEKMGSYAGQLERLWSWKDVHIAEVGKRTMDIASEFSELKARVITTENHYDEILRMLSQISGRIEQMDKRFDTFHQQK